MHRVSDCRAGGPPAVTGRLLLASASIFRPLAWARAILSAGGPPALQKYSVFILFLAFSFCIYPAQGQDARKIPISFLPPPLETTTFSLGIYDAKTGKLVRRLKEDATQSAFTVGLNGLITEWDGKDDDGKLVPPGKYAARGYAMGALKVEGVETLGNDWAANDENMRISRVNTINILPPDDALVVLATTTSGDVQVFCFDDSGTKLRWTSKPLTQVQNADPARNDLSVNTDFVSAQAGDHTGIYHASNGQGFQGVFDQFMQPSGPTSLGKDRTTWKIEAGVLTQYSLHGEKLRQLTAKPDDPTLIAVAASTKDDRLFLLEESGDWQRVRGLAWVETKEEDGKPVSTWQTFFERNIHSGSPAAPTNPVVPVRVNLAENPLDPGKPQAVDLDARVDDKGSYLTTTHGLRLRRISERPHLVSAHLGLAKGLGAVPFLQYDGAATDSFSIAGVKNMMAFDAGEIEMTADGEKVHAEKAAEPPEP